jgi:periplasmic copper chaperone A
MTLFKHILLASALTLSAFAGMASSNADEIKLGNLMITQPWSRQSPMASDVAAGFLSITNTGTADDQLVKATASITSKVQLHDMKIENDVMKMVELPAGIPIPAGATIELKPKSLHVMFMDLQKPVVEGEKITGTLVFEKAGSVDVTFDVRAMGAGME